MRVHVAMAGVATAILLGGCTSANAGSPPTVALTAGTVAHVTSAPSPVPSPVAEMTMDEAAQLYLDLVRPGNELIDDTTELWGDSVNARDWQQVSALAARSLEAEQTLRTGVIAAAWPAELVPLMDEFVAQQDADIAWYLALVNASSEDEFWAAYDTFDMMDRSASQEIRLQLGLDSLS